MIHLVTPLDNTHQASSPGGTPPSQPTDGLPVAPLDIRPSERLRAYRASERSGTNPVGPIRVRNLSPSREGRPVAERSERPAKRSQDKPRSLPARGSEEACEPRTDARERQIANSLLTYGPKGLSPAPLDNGLQSSALNLLVQALDFAPRYKDLAVRLAQRFTSSQASLRAGPLNLDRLSAREALIASFFDWLQMRTAAPNLQRQRGRESTRSTDGLRLMGLLDQYRSGASPLRKRGAGRYSELDPNCPLVQAADSLGA